MSPTQPESSTLFTRSYTVFLAGRFCAVLASTSQAVVIAWEVYETARQSMTIAEASFVVGMIGLVTFLPLVALALVAGETADRYDRRTILRLCYAGQVITSAALAVRSGTGGGLWQIFVMAAMFGCARAFFQPTVSALAPMLVPPQLLPRAIATNSLVAQVANISGPALGGVLCAVSPTFGYVVSLSLFVVAVLCVSLIRANTRPATAPTRSRLAQIKEGLAYVWGNKLVLGAISLDMFAVLLGGVTGLLPVFARDILHVGPEGFGVLRGAPAIGALFTASLLSIQPIRRHVGLKMFVAVAVFGLMTLAFGYSRSFPLSVACLAVLGAADMVSVFTRQSLVQIMTPDRMRGRVSAVSTLFIGASNELGEFESGVAARFLGPVGAVLFGGAGSLTITGLWAWLFPSLRNADRLVSPPPDQPPSSPAPSA